MEVFRQIQIDDEQRHCEGENAVGQGIEAAFRNKLLGLSHHPAPVFSCGRAASLPLGAMCHKLTYCVQQNKIIIQTTSSAMASSLSKIFPRRTR